MKPFYLRQISYCYIAINNLLKTSKLTSSCQLPKRFMRPLMISGKAEVFSVKYQKGLTKSGMKV